MRCFLLFVVLVFFFTNTDGQTKDTIVYTFDQMVAVGNNDIVALLVDQVENPSKLYLKYINSEDQVIAEKHINLNRRGVKGQLEAIFYWNGKLNILSSLYYPGPKRNNLIFTQYELPNLTELVTKKIDEAYTPGLYRIPFGYSLSPDSTKILFYSWSYAIPDDPARLSLHLLDQNLKLIWQDYELLPFKNEALYIYGCQVDNVGKAYILCENYEGKVSRNMTVNERKIKYFALLMEPEVKELRIYPLEVEDKTITGIKFTLGPNNDLFAAGFFKDKRTFEGLFLFRVNGTSKKLSRKLFPISNDTYKKAYAAGNDPNPQKGFYDFIVDDIKMADDGSLFLIAEQRNNPDNFPVTYEYNDLLAFKISPKRILDWLIRVPKRQKRVLATESIFSYAVFEKNGQLYFLFNDEKSNARKRNKIEKLDVFPGGNTVNIIVRVKEDGTWRGNDISGLTGSSTPLTIFPSYCWSLKDRLIIYGERVENNQTSGYFLKLDWQLLGQ